MSSAIVLIPARFNSTRFPGKPLATISGQSMIQRVYNNCMKSGFTVAVVTDNDEIENHVLNFGGKVVRVNDDVPSGSERIALAYGRYFKELNPKLVINVQGDEPLLHGEILKELAEFHLKNSFDITTLIRERKSSEDDFKNHNIVKAVWSDTNGKCHYFSRASLPYDRDQKNDYSWYQHIGVYSYLPNVLEKFVKLPVTRHEDLEKLEQLRALDNGYSIGAVLTTQKLIGVDVPEDIKKVEEYL